MIDRPANRRSMVRRAMIGGTIAGCGASLLPGSSLMGSARFGSARAASAVALDLVEVAPGLWAHKGLHEPFGPDNLGDIANVALIVGAEKAAVVDTGGSLPVGEALFEAARAIADRPIAYVINTHMHPDHVMGNAAFVREGGGEDGVVFVGHVRMPTSLDARRAHYLRHTLALMRQDAPDDIPGPTLLVDETLDLDLGGRILRLQSWPTAHTDNDLTVLDLESGVFLAGDLLFMERMPVVDGSLLGWIAVMDRLEAEIDSPHVLPGHGPRLAPWPEALERQRAYLEGLRDELRAAIAAGASLGGIEAETGPARAGPWALEELDHPRNLITGYTELEWE